MQELYEYEIRKSKDPLGTCWPDINVWLTTYSDDQTISFFLAGLRLKRDTHFRWNRKGSLQGHYITVKKWSK